MPMQKMCELRGINQSINQFIRQQRAEGHLQVAIYRVAQNKMPYQRICNISATSGLILQTFEAA